jgi:hypothetical protein
MRPGLLLALCTGVLLAFYAPARATIVVFGHQQGLSGQSTAQPGEEVTIYSVRLVNDGTSSLQAIDLTLSDLSTGTGINAAAFSQLRLYRSTDATFSAGSDSLVATQPSVNLGTTTSLTLATPLTWSSSFPYFIATVVLNSTHADELGAAKDAFRVGAAAGAIQTSSGNTGSAIIADNGNSVAIDVVATQIAVATPPGDAAAPHGDVVSGQAFATQPILEARDANGNTDVDISGSAAIAVQTGNVALSGTASRAWSNGRAAFTDLSISAPSDATPFVLSATSAGLASVATTSLIADIVATQLVFTRQPAHAGVTNGDVLSGVAFQTQPIVKAQNASGVLDSHFVDQVTLTTVAGTLSGTTTIQAVSGVAAFTDLSYTAAADQESFTLVANDEAGGSGGDLPTANANALTADIVATQIVFATPPADGSAANGDVVSGQTFATQPILEARNANGQRDLNFTGSVTLSLPPGNPTLSGTVSETWISGRADFAGNGLRVTATSDATSFALSASSGLLSGQSATLVADVVATQIAFLTQPSDVGASNGDVVSGQAFATQPVLEARDDNNVADLHYAGPAPTLSLQSGSVALSGTTSQAWSSGRATFTDLTVTATNEGQSFVLAANNGNLPQITTASLIADIVATQLVFTRQPAHAGVTNGDVLSGVAFQTQPIVQAQNASGVLDSHFVDQVTLATAAAGTLSGTTTIQAVSGVAAFTDLSYTAAADQERFTLVANDEVGGSGGDLPTANANALTADIVASQIVFTTLPADPAATNGDVVSGQAFATQPVLEVQNASGQRDLNFTASVTLSSSAIALFGTVSVSWSAGRANFANSGLGASASGDGSAFTLNAQTPGLPTVATNTLIADIVASQIVFATPPADPAASNGDVVSGQAFATQPILEAQNASGQRDLHLSGPPVTLAVTSGSATLSGISAINWSSGRAAFAGLAISASSDGAPFVLSATSDGLASANTASLTADIVATQLAFSTQPAHSGVSNGDIFSGVAFQSQPVVQAQNASGALDTHFTDQVTLTTAAAGALTGATTVQAINGTAAFTDLAYTAAVDQESFTLLANDEVGGSGGDLPTATASARTADIVATQLVFATPPADPAATNGSVVNGRVFAIQPILEAQNASGQRDLDINNATATLSTSGSSVALSGTTVASWNSGRAVFSNLMATGSSDGESFVLSAAANSLPTAQLVLTNDVVATQLVFASQPAQSGLSTGTVSHGTPFSTQPIIEARDALNARDIHVNSGQATLSVASGAATLSGTTARNWSAGRADFATNTLALHTATDGASTMLKATSAGFQDILSNALTIDIRATHLVFVQTPHTSATLSSELIDGLLTVRAVHQDGAIDAEFAEPIALNAVAPEGAAPLSGLTLAPGRTLIPNAGQVHYTSAVFNRAGRIQLLAVSQGLESARSPTLALTGSLTLLSPVQPIADQLAFQRDATPRQIPLFAFRAMPTGENLALKNLTVRLELGGGISASHVDTLQLWRDSGAAGILDPSDRLISSIQPNNAAQALFTGLSDTLSSEQNYLVTWNARSALQPGWTLRAHLSATDISAHSTQIPDATVPASGDDIAGVLHQVGNVGQPHHLLVEASPNSLTADSLAQATITATIVDAQGRTIDADDRTLVHFTALSGSALIDGPLSAQAQNGRAETLLRAGTSADTARIRASASGLLPDTIAVALVAGPAARIDLSALPQSILLESGDSTQLTAILRDAHGNITRGDQQVLFALTGPADFVDGISAVNASDGRASTRVRATAPGTLRVVATTSALRSEVDIAIIATQPPFITLSASRTQIPADGSVSTQITAFLRDARGQILSGDDTTRVAFSVVGGQALVSQGVAIANNGLAHIQVRGLGLAGTIVIKAQASHLESAEIQLRARAAAAHRIELVAVPATIVADRQSTSVLSAVVRDSLGNIVPESTANISFFIDDGDAEIIGPQTAQSTAGTARTTVRSSIRSGQVLLRAEANGLRSGSASLHLVTGPPAKIQLLASPAALPAGEAANAELLAELQDVHGNLVVADSTTVVSFSISGGPATIGTPNFARTSGGQARSYLSSTGETGKILVFAGASGLAPSTFEVPVRQAQAPRFNNREIALVLQEDGTPARLDLYALVSDADSPTSDLSFALSTETLPVDLAIEQGELVVTPTTPNYSGSLQTTLIARDPTGLEDRAQLYIEVTAQNDAPVITSIPDTVVANDSLYVYRLSGQDPDGDVLSFVLLEGPANMRFDRALGRAAWRAGPTGVYTVRFAVSDGREESEQSFRLHVVSTDGRMEFSNQAPTRARHGQLYSYQPQLINAPANAPHFTLVTAPANMRIDPNSGLISWLPSTDGPANVAVSIRASSGQQQALQSFQIRLVAGNEAPLIVSTPIAEASVDSLYLYSVRAADADGDTLVYTIVNGPQDMRINPLSGLVAWVPSREDIGRHEIAVGAYDGQLNDTQRFQLTVSTRSLPPTIAAIKGLALDANGSATLELTALSSDADHAFNELIWSIEKTTGDPVEISYNAGDTRALFSVGDAFVQAQLRLRVSDPDGNSSERLLRLARRESSDFNGDASVDLSDFFTLVDAFGASPAESRWNGSADLNGDGTVDFDDFFVFIDSFNRSNTPGK